MGNGFFNNVTGKFTLNLCFENFSKTKDKKLITACLNAFDVASQKLYAITGGKMQFGTLKQKFGKIDYNTDAAIDKDPNPTFPGVRFVA